MKTPKQITPQDYYLLEVKCLMLEAENDCLKKRLGQMKPSITSAVLLKSDRF